MLAIAKRGCKSSQDDQKGGQAEKTRHQKRISAKSAKVEQLIGQETTKRNQQWPRKPKAKKARGSRYNDGTYR
jgi:hypothetical protein